MRDASANLLRASRTFSRAAMAAALLARLRARRLRQHRGGGSGSFAMAGRAAAPPSPSNRSTARRRMCSTAWSACSTANPSCAISRSSPAKAAAAYRVRSYLSAQVVRGRTTIAWVWDVYDANQQRALRLSGEEPAGKAGRDAWAAADDLVLRKIAQAGLSGLSGMINGRTRADAPPPAPAPGPPRTGGRQPGTGHGFAVSALELQRPINVKTPGLPNHFDRENRASTGCQPDRRA